MDYEENSGILLTAATPMELEVMQVAAKKLSVRFETLVTGIGPFESTWKLASYLAANTSPQLVINGGIAGSFDAAYGPGSVVLVGRDTFAGLGTEEGDRFVPSWLSGLTDGDAPPFSGGWIGATPRLLRLMGGVMPVVDGITVSRVTGSERTRRELADLFNPVIETMEGAAVYYSAAMGEVNVLGIRSVSNMAGERDRRLWKVKEALARLGEAMETVLIKIGE